MALMQITNREKLVELDPRLDILVREVAKILPVIILTGYRGIIEQNKAFESGKSLFKFPQSKHNKTPSFAVDLAPMPLDWKDTKRFYYFGGFVLGIANRLGMSLIWGGDWDRDHDLNDQKLMDLVHFELML